MHTQKQLSAVIVEDEQLSASMLETMLKEYAPNIEVVGIAYTLEDAYEIISLHNPQVVFLDIEMPDGTAFDLLGKFAAFNFALIFTTAYDSYALKAIKCNATDYLLKPIQASDLVRAVYKIQDSNFKSGIKHELLETIQQLRIPMQHTVTIPTINGLVFIDSQDILYCKAEGSYTNIHLQDKTKILVAKTIKEYDQKLPSYFFRIHNSYIVNTHFIIKYVNGRGGYIIMKDGTEIEVAARKKEQFLRIFRG